MRGTLKPKERVFCKLLADGKSATDAYLSTHENATENRAEAGMHAYRFKQRIIEKIGYAGFLDFMGISDEAITRAHNETLKSNDERVKIRATKLGYQVRGRLIEQQRVDANVTGMPTSFVAWLKQDKAKEQDENADADRDNPDTETTDGD